MSFSTTNRAQSKQGTQISVTLNIKKKEEWGVGLTSAPGLLLAEAGRGLKEIKKDK